MEFRLGEIEHLPIENNLADLIISNCVINLSPEKRLVFRDAFRVLKPGGRLAVSGIRGAVSHSFDDFLKSILIDGEYGEFKTKALMLVCDTGHQSRVAAGILAEEGFMHATSLNRGMRRWDKWQNLLRSRKKYHRKRLHCCATV